MSLRIVVKVSLRWHSWGNIDTIRNLLIHSVHHAQGVFLSGLQYRRGRGAVSKKGSMHDHLQGCGHSQCN